SGATVMDTTAPTSTSPVIDPAVSSAKSSEKAIKTLEPGITAAQTYSATAYSLRGRTASGRSPARGVIAADPRLLPLGTRVRIEAGEFSGEYVVADTGGAVKGHRVDIWTPTAREAMRFGRRAVKLTVLELGGRRGSTASTRSRRVIASPADAVVSTEQTKKQQK